MRRPNPLFALAFLLSALLTMPAGAAEPGPTQVRRSGPALALSNDFIEIGFLTDGKWCPAVRLVNKLAGRAIPLRGDDFSVGVEGRAPLRAADFSFREAREEAVPGGKRLTLEHESAGLGARLDLVYELGDSDFFIRRRLELVPKSPLAIRRVDVWQVGLDGKCSRQGSGAPVLLEDTFWGVESPASQNQYADGIVRLSHFPGRTVSGRFTSKTAVVGVAEPGQAARRFHRYIDTLAPAKRPPLFVNYNTWWTLMPPTETNALELIELFKRRLYDPYGQSIDTFTLDDGWDVNDSLWAIDAKALPRGFAPLVQRLKGMNANLGIWLSPSSGYSHAPWLSTHGYKANSNPWYICQSDPNYRRDIVKVVTDLARKYDVAFFKFDGFAATCESPGHAHLGGPFAQEANVDAFIELMSAVRRVRPGIYLDPTCGIWLSPWWLQYADSLWGEVSGDYPDIVVPAPIIRDSATTTRDAMFRQRCREHPDFPPAAIEHLGIIVITPEIWEDNAMIVAGRGCRLLTLYIDPKMFRSGERDWAFLASLLKWIRHNADTLRHTELILGDPMKREPYGYAHFNGKRGIIAVRNPFIEPKTVEIKLDESAGWSRVEGKYLARIVYPRHQVLGLCGHGGTARLALGAYETLVIHLEPSPPEQPVLMGAPYQEQRRSASAATFTVCRQAGSETVLYSPLKTRGVVERHLPGGVSRIAAPHDAALLHPAAGEEKLVVEPGRVTAESRDSGWELTADCAASGPPATKLTIYVLVDPRGGTLEGVQGTALVNDRPVEVRVVRSPPKPEQAHGPHPWRWYASDLPLGKSKLTFTLRPERGGPLPRCEIGCWLWVEEPLVKETVTIQYSQKLPASGPEPLPLPIGTEHQRHVFTLLAPKRFQLGPRWPKADQSAVYLDEIAPDESTQDYGKLERNRSVWEKEMIVAGKKFARGLGSHANGRIAYDLSGGNFKTFRCQVGRDEHAGDGIVVYQVWLDGKKAFDSGPMTKATAAKPVEIDVRGAGLLELRVLDGGDGISGDHANWAEAQLIR